ncbi:hypothetical protein LXL04_035215 [Taraxacum kok-saghyz]
MKLGKVTFQCDKSIITCLEYIGEYLMKILCAVQQAMNRCHGILTPTTTKLLEDIKKEAAKYTTIYNGTGKYQVGRPKKRNRGVLMSQEAI